MPVRPVFRYLRPLHNAISPRNEGCAGLGGRICRVVKSLQILSHNHTYQYTQMVNAPAGGQAGAARCCHRAKCFVLTVRKVVLADAFTVNICGAAMQSAAKGIGISQVHFDHFHAQLVHLFCLIDFRFFDTNSFWIQNENIHAQPCGGIA